MSGDKRCGEGKKEEKWVKANDGYTRMEPFETSGVTVYKVVIRVKLSSRLDPGGFHPPGASTNCRQLKFSSSEAHARILPSRRTRPPNDQFLASN